MKREEIRERIAKEYCGGPIRLGLEEFILGILKAEQERCCDIAMDVAPNWAWDGKIGEQICQRIRD